MSDPCSCCKNQATVIIAWLNQEALFCDLHAKELSDKMHALDRHITIGELAKEKSL